MTRKQSDEVEDLGPLQKDLTCPFCGKFVTTKIKTVSSKKSNIFTVLKCLCCCFMCCPASYCADSFKERHHYCPECNEHLGAYR